MNMIDNLMGEMVNNMTNEIGNMIKNIQDSLCAIRIDQISIIAEMKEMGEHIAIIERCASLDMVESREKSEVGALNFEL